MVENNREYFPLLPPPHPHTLVTTTTHHHLLSQGQAGNPLGVPVQQQGLFQGCPGVPQDQGGGEGIALGPANHQQRTVVGEAGNIASTT